MKIPALLPKSVRPWLACLALSPLAARADVVVESSDGRVSLEDGRVKIEHAGAVAAEVRAFEFNFTAPKSLAVKAPGVLRAVYPAPAKYQNEQGDLPVDIAVEAVPGGFRFHAKPIWAFNTTVRLADLDDHFFGLMEQLYPDNRPSPDLRGNVVDIEAVSDASAYHENWASVWSPFYMTSRAYASFFDTFAKGRYTLGINGETKLVHRTGALDWYLFFGRDGDEILASYYKVIGAPKQAPLWGSGPVAWRDVNNGGGAEVVEDVRHMTALHIPFTSWWVDRPYSDGRNGWSQMNFTAPLFGDPGKWIGQLRSEYDVTLMTWIGPMTFGDPDFPGLLPGDRGYMDLSDPAAVAEWEKRMVKGQYAFGVRGHKMDRAEEFLPETAPWHDGTQSSDTRNKYLFLYAKVTDEMLRKAWGDDHYNFARGAVQRTQQYLSGVWGGDVRASWDGLGGDLAGALRCGFMGFPVWGSDCGGYLGGRIDEELYARWVEFGAWSGLFEIKLDNLAGRPPDRPPWVYSQKLQDAFREACQWRMELLPYVFSLARTSATHGVLMKPLAYVWPSDAATYAVGDEYLFGPSFLVAPLTLPGGHRSVYLPEGTWYDLYAPGQSYEGRRTVEVSRPFEHIPVFVRANSIYVTGHVPVGSQKVWDRSPTSFAVHAAPGKAGEGTRFDLVDTSDGDRVKTIELGRSGDAVTISAPALGAPAQVELRADSAPTAASGGSPVAVSYDAAAHAARVAVPAGQAIALTFTLAK